jgi:hypothetical protein
MSRKKPQSKRINIDTRERWKSILKTVNKVDVPVSMIQKVTVNLIDGTKVDVDLTELFDEGYDAEEIETMLNMRLVKLDEVIKDVDYFINIDNVASTVQPVTDDILKNL